MDMKDSLGNLMKEAQKMQEKMQAAQKELIDTIVTGKAGAGTYTVTVELDGRHMTRSINISQSLVDDADKDMIEDLVAAAYNNAVETLEGISKKKIEQLTSGLKLPTDFGSLGQDKE
jgi:hypothetical protein